VLVFQCVLLLLFLLNSIENLFQMFRVRWLHFSYFGIVPLGHAQRSRVKLPDEYGGFHRIRGPCEDPPTRPQASAQTRYIQVGPMEGPNPKHETFSKLPPAGCLFFPSSAT
jgi:hypothetical protein